MTGQGQAAARRSAALLAVLALHAVALHVLWNAATPRVAVSPPEPLMVSLISPPFEPARLVPPSAPPAPHPPPSRPRQQAEALSPRRPAVAEVHPADPAPAPVPAATPVLAAPPVVGAAPRPELPATPAASQRAGPATAPPGAGGLPQGPIDLPGQLEVACPDRPPPAYPPLARRMGEQGDVVLRVELNEDGSVAAARVQRSSGHVRLDDAALAAIRTWHCSPPTRGGHPMRAVAMQPFHFVLAD